MAVVMTGMRRTASSAEPNCNVRAFSATASMGRCAA
jgi:hypothetical protein